MPTYIRKTIKILPWVTLNISKSGMSVSIGPKGAKLNIGKNGAYVNTSIKGTGVYNRTKLSTSLLWAILVAGVFAVIGYFVGIQQQNYNLFLIICGVGVLVGILVFLLLRSIRKVADSSGETVVREPSTRKSSGGKVTRTTKTATTKTASAKKGGTRTSGRTTTRTENASAKAYVDEVETLLGKMADAKTLDELNKHHSAILDIMYTNLKPMGVKVLDMDFDEALATIEQEYAEGVKVLSGK